VPTDLQRGVKGAGNASKLAKQIMFAYNMAVIGEALVLARPKSKSASWRVNASAPEESRICLPCNEKPAPGTAE
jgi:hypothetical protein